MWPVLSVEKDARLPSNVDEYDRLQGVIGKMSFCVDDFSGALVTILV